MRYSRLSFSAALFFAAFQGLLAIAAGAIGAWLRAPDPGIRKVEPKLACSPPEVKCPLAPTGGRVRPRRVSDSAWRASPTAS